MNRWETLYIQAFYRQTPNEQQVSDNPLYELTDKSRIPLCTT